MRGALGHIGIGKEVTFGTAVAASSYIPFESESLARDIEQIKDPSIRAVAVEAATLEGLHSFKGDISALVRPSFIGHILRSALGDPTTTGAGPYTHVFLPRSSEFSADCFLAPYTFEIHRDLGNAFQYSGAVVDSLKLACGGKDKLLKATLGIIAQDETNIAKTTPSFETNAPFLWSNAALKIATVSTTDFEDFGVNINNNMEGVAVMNATNKIAQILPGNDFLKVDVEGSINVKDLTEYNRFVAQSQTAFEWTFTAGTFIFKVELPKVKYTAFPLGISGPGRQTVKFKGVADHDSVTGGPVKITLTNSTVSY